MSGRIICRIYDELVAKTAVVKKGSVPLAEVERERERKEVSAAIIDSTPWRESIDRCSQGG